MLLVSDVEMLTLVKFTCVIYALDPIECWFALINLIMY